MSPARYIVGDVFDVLASLEPGSVDLVMTSPPFLALRSYLPADHEHKHKEIGSEATPGEFIDTMLDVVEACARVLAPHGSLVFELGDTYAGSGGAGGDYAEGGLRDGAPGFDGSARRTRMVESREHRAEREGTTADGGARVVPLNSGRGWPLDKSKVLIPQLFAIALAYGFNPLTGRQTEPWRVRNTVAWCRPNPPVGRDGDKFRSATSFLTVACKARDRYWDGDAVRTALQPGSEKPRSYAQSSKTEREPDARGVDRMLNTNGQTSNPAGAPLLDWWEIPTEPVRLAHYATFPRKLVVPVLASMCPQKVCRACGKPSTRITEPDAEAQEFNKGRRDGRFNDPTIVRPLNESRGDGGAALFKPVAYTTLGWSDCGHEDWRTGHVLDPFGGSGTTAAVATGHGLDCTLIDLDERNAELAYERIGGLFLSIEHFEAPASVPAA